MRHVINQQVVLSQAPEGPLANWLEGFADAASRQGYVRSSICRRIRLAADFSRWLKQEGIGLNCISSEHPAQYLRSRTRHVRPHPDAAPLGHLIDFLRLEAVIPAETIPLGRESEAERCVLASVEFGLDAEALAHDGDEHIDRHSDPDLRLDRILGVPEEALDPEMLLDPLEDQLHLPARLVQGADGLGIQGHLVGQEHERAFALAITEANPAQGVGIQRPGSRAVELDT